jgi:DNA-binding CsgD family transcriptional regulator
LNRDGECMFKINLEQNVASISKKLDFEFYAACLIEASHFGVCQKIPTLYATNYSQMWERHYIDNALHTYDPILYFARLVSYPVTWDRLKEASGFCAAHQNVLSSAHDFGLKSGACMSIHNLDGSMMIVAFASSSERKISDLTLNEMSKSAHQLSQIRGKSKPERSDIDTLTDREVECLKWCSLGKTSHDISAILEISSNTVDFHLKGAMRKLSTNSRTFAIVKAMRNGIIPL